MYINSIWCIQNQMKKKSKFDIKRREKKQTKTLFVEIIWNKYWSGVSWESKVLHIQQPLETVHRTPYKDWTEAPFLSLKLKMEIS